MRSRRDSRSGSPGIGPMACSSVSVLCFRHGQRSMMPNDDRCEIAEGDGEDVFEHFEASSKVCWRNECIRNRPRVFREKEGNGELAMGIPYCLFPIPAISPLISPATLFASSLLGASTITRIIGSVLLARTCAQTPFASQSIRIPSTKSTRQSSFFE